jgi:hypothetical protein
MHENERLFSREASVPDGAAVHRMVIRYLSSFPPGGGRSGWGEEESHCGMKGIPVRERALILEFQGVLAARRR